jgi:adenylate cyclase
MTDLERWIIGQGLGGADLGSLLSGFAERLLADGIPVVRIYLALPTVNPTVRAYSHSWTRSAGALVEPVSHERNRQAFEASPFRYMLQAGLSECHWRFDEVGTERFPAFDEVERAGGRDYLARLIRYQNASAPDLAGLAAAFSADCAGGFRSEEVARIDAVLPLLALAAYRITLFDLTVAMLDTYVGLSARHRVLSGEIRRGDGTTITAALYFADLRGFTALADTAGIALLGRLNKHLEAMTGPVAEQGGELLKFLGDGLLAVFPITDERPQEAACAAAVRAAREALLRNASVNRFCPDEPPLDLDVALHCGDVFYGNIGDTSRLDFTVIGPAVNEASRMEALCGPLGCSIVMSEAVAAASPVPVHSLGRHWLRGIASPRELFTLASVSGAGA